MSACKYIIKTTHFHILPKKKIQSKKKTFGTAESNNIDSCRAKIIININIKI